MATDPPSAMLLIGTTPGFNRGRVSMATDPPSAMLLATSGQAGSFFERFNGD